MSADIAFLDATRLAELIRNREMSSVEVVQAHLDRIDAINPKINAVVTVAEAALQQAREADTALRSGKEPGPLHGVPFTVKDHFDTAGVAIREGVYKSLEITAEHFLDDYKKRARFFIYNSKQLHNLESFSSDAGINVMVINVQAFNATGKDARRIYEELDDFQSRRPIDVISANRPIMFLDEPQKMEGGKTLDALANFNLSSSITVDSVIFFVVTPAEQPKLDVGRVVNISTRGNIAPGSEPLIGGFVIEDQPCRVLVRGIGPTLSGFNVPTPLADPAIKLFRQSSGIATNNDWAQQNNVSEIEAVAAAVGAFPLTRGSKDAALLVELPPGVYTAHLSSADGTGGTALLEIYKLP